MRRLILLTTLGITCAMGAEPTAKPATAKTALKQFNSLIGSWRSVGQPFGPNRQTGAWTEKMKWGWRFKKDQAWLVVDFEKSKNFRRGEMHYLTDKKKFELRLWGNDRKQPPLVFQGVLQKRQLQMERLDPKSKETQRLVFSLLHSNRIVYRYEVKKPGRTLFTRMYQVGATKEGVAFAKGSTGPECIVSGGLGTITVSYKGKTYHVCCSGCRQAFMDEPDKFIKEYEAKQAKQNKNR